MTVTFAAALSADAGNGLSFGSDSGLFATAPPVPPGGTSGHTVDVSQANPGQAWWYSLPGATAALTASTSAVYWPLLVTRPARLTGVAINVTTAGTGSLLRNALCAADPVSGLPGAVLSAAWFNVNTGTVAFATGTVTDTVPVLAAFTPYYVLTWLNTGSAYPAFTCRTGTTSIPLALPRVGLPTANTAYNTGYFGYVETVSAATWAGLSAPPATVGTSGLSLSSYTPYYWLQFTNV